MVVQAFPVGQAARPEPDWRLRVVRSESGVIASYIRQLSEAATSGDRRSRPPSARGEPR